MTTNFSDFKRKLTTSITTKNDLKSFFEKISNTISDIENSDNQLDNKIIEKIIFLIENEDLGILDDRWGKRTNYSNDPPIFTDYSKIEKLYSIATNFVDSGLLRKKKFKLLNTLPIVYCGITGKDGYANEGNLNAELESILKRVDSSFSDTGAFVNFLNINSFSDLCFVNNKLPEIFKSQAIERCSILLNYKYEDIKAILNDSSLKDNFNFLTEFSDEDLDNYKKYQQYFIEFLNKLTKETINYR